MWPDLFPYNECFVTVLLLTSTLLIDLKYILKNIVKNTVWVFQLNLSSQCLYVITIHVHRGVGEGGIPPWREILLTPPGKFDPYVVKKKQNFFYPPPSRPIGPCTCMVITHFTTVVYSKFLYLRINVIVHDYKKELNKYTRRSLNHWPTRPRPNRWSSFSRMVSVRHKNKLRSTTDTMPENNDCLLAGAWWVIFNSPDLFPISFA